MCLNGSTFNDIKRPRILRRRNLRGEISASTPDAARLCDPTRLERDSPSLPSTTVDPALPVGRDIDEAYRTKSYLAQKKELAAKLPALVRGLPREPGPPEQPTDSLFTWAADIMLKHRQDPNRSDAAEIYGKMDCADKTGGRNSRCGEATPQPPVTAGRMVQQASYGDSEGPPHSDPRGELKAQAEAQRKQRQTPPPAR